MASRKKPSYHVRIPRNDEYNQFILERGPTDRQKE